MHRVGIPCARSPVGSVQNRRENREMSSVHAPPCSDLNLLIRVPALVFLGEVSPDACARQTCVIAYSLFWTPAAQPSLNPNWNATLQTWLDVAAATLTRARSLFPDWELRVYGRRALGPDVAARLRGLGVALVYAQPPQPTLADTMEGRRNSVSGRRSTSNTRRIHCELPNTL